ncbi:MAG: hypothetical protein PHG03_04160 [Bacilli bacterium]|nr:hypothetical protein [Bacilli bacterium]MDD4795735.1 hypothetical protein [Bacilli bacterium]
MKKDILKPLLEIFVISIILAFSFPTWQNINAEVENIDLVIADSSNDNGLQVYELELTDVKILNNESDFKVNNIVINNSTSIKRSGTLLLMYSKLSTIDYQDLLVDINGESFDLSDLFLVVNKDYYVFKLDEISLSKFTNKEYLVSYNIKENTPVENIIGKYFDANINISENVNV